MGPGRVGAFGAGCLPDPRSRIRDDVPTVQGRPVRRAGLADARGTDLRSRERVSRPPSRRPTPGGKGGRTVREAEDCLGVIIGIIDAVNDQEAAVTLVGPRESVEVTQVVLGLLAKGVRSALSRLGGVG